MTTPIPADPTANVPAEPAPVVPAPTVPTPAPVSPAAPQPVTPEPADGEPKVFDLAYVEKLRKEAAGHRTKVGEATAAHEAATAAATAAATERDQMAATLAAIMKAAGVVTDDEPADPVKLAEQLAAEKAQREADVAKLTADHAAQVRALTVQATLPAVLAKAGANPGLTSAVLTADGTLAKLDPASDTFAADLESAVVAALEAHPQLKVAPVATRSGTEITGRSGGSDQLTLEQVKGMTPAEIDKARVAGRLKNLGIG